MGQRFLTNGEHVMTTLYVTAVLLALVGVACTVLCLIWSVPSWRRRLARTVVATDGLQGWPALVGSGVVSVGIAICAAFALHGCYALLVSLS